MNKYIKEVCKLARIDNNVIVNHYKGGRPIQSQKKKFQLISSHTARRSFATNSTKRGIPSNIIMTATGHKKESTFRKYVQTTDRENIDLFNKLLKSSV